MSLEKAIFLSIVLGSILRTQLICQEDLNHSALL